MLLPSKAADGRINVNDCSRVFILTGLRSSLIELHIANNPEITDECTPALNHIGRLQYLDISGTAITIVGLRRMALDFVQGDTARLRVEVPVQCSEYMNSTCMVGWSLIRTGAAGVTLGVLTPPLLPFLFLFC